MSLLYDITSATNFSPMAETNEMFKMGEMFGNKENAPEPTMEEPDDLISAANPTDLSSVITRAVAQPTVREIKKIGDEKKFGNSRHYEPGPRKYEDYWRAANESGWKNLYLPMDFFYELAQNVPNYYTKFACVPQASKKKSGACLYYNFAMISPDEKSSITIKEITVVNATTTGLTAYAPSNQKAELPDFNNCKANTLLINSCLRNNTIDIWLNSKNGIENVPKETIVRWFGLEFRQVMRLLAASYINAKGNVVIGWNPVTNESMQITGRNLDTPSGSVTIDLIQSKENYDDAAKKASGFFVKMSDFRPANQRNNTNFSGTATVRFARPPPPEPILESSFADPQILRRFHQSNGMNYAINASIYPQASIMAGKINISFNCEKIVILASIKIPSRLSSLEITYNEDAHFEM